MKRGILSILLVSTGLLAAEMPYAIGLKLTAQPAKIYASECASCHGTNGKQTSFSGFPGVITYGKIAGLNADELAKTIKAYRGGIESKDYQPLNKYGYGAAMNAPTRDLSWDEVDAVAKYISTLK